MQDPHNTRVGLITDGTRAGTVYVDPETQRPRTDLPPFRKAVYGVKNGLCVLTLEIAAVPAIIDAVVRRVRWIKVGDRFSYSESHTPYPEHNPMGRRLRFECDGTFAGIRPLDVETEEVFTKMPFTEFELFFEDGECAIMLTCLVQKRA